MRLLGQYGEHKKDTSIKKKKVNTYDDPGESAIVYHRKISAGQRHVFFGSYAVTHEKGNPEHLIWHREDPDNAHDPR